ncbi:MAG: hypothetical protein D6732_18855, partial [Methanobacteriota archaeon]
RAVFGQECAHIPAEVDGGVEQGGKKSIGRHAFARIFHAFHPARADVNPMRKGEMVYRQLGHGCSFV